MALQLQQVPNQQIQVGELGALAIDIVHRLRTSWSEARTATSRSKKQVSIAWPVPKSSWSEAEVREFERDVLSAEEFADFIESFVEQLRQAGKDDDKARDIDTITGNPDLSKALEIFEMTYVDEAKRQVGILDNRVKHWPEFASSRLLNSTLPNPLVQRVIQLDIQLNEWVDEVFKDYNNTLIMQLFTRVAKFRPLTLGEKMRLDDAAKLEWKVKSHPSYHRGDWYDEG